MDFPYWILVPLAGIIGWVIVTVSSARARQHASTRELARRVEELERRISSIEKGA